MAGLTIAAAYANLTSGADGCKNRSCPCATPPE